MWRVWRQDARPYMRFASRCFTKFVTSIALTGIGFSQASLAAPPTASDADSQSTATPEPLDTKLNVANPFATPWLMNSEALQSLEPKAPNATSDASLAPLPRTTYRLEPDPFDLNLQLGGPLDDDRLSQSSSSAVPGVATQLANQPPTKLEPLKSQAKKL